MDFIPINSIADIDPEKISIRDINKRYIDRDGNRYATRFNLQTRRVEVVRIAKTKAEAQRISQQIRQQKIQDRRTRPAAQSGGTAPTESDARADNDFDDGPPPPEPEIPDYDDFEHDDLSAPSGDSGVSVPNTAPAMQTGVFIEQHLIDEIVAHLGRCREGQQVVINNLKNSRCFEEGGTDLNDLLRDIDVECWQATESAINYYKELYGYPRAVAQYLIRLSPEDRKRAEALPDDEQRLEVIRRLETRKAFRALYEKILEMTGRVIKLIHSVPEEARSQMMAAQRQQLEDAEASSQILVEEAQEKLGQIELWRKRYP